MIIAYLIVVGIVIIDQITKFIIRTNMTVGQTVTAIPYLFNICYTNNLGAAWGIGNNLHWLLSVISILAAIAIGYFVYKKADFKHHKVLSISLALMMGGCIGNGIDRIFLPNGVTDFIQFAFWTEFPIFNVADICLTFGVIMILIHLLFLDEDAILRKKTKKLEDQGDESNL